MLAGVADKPVSTLDFAICYPALRGTIRDQLTHRRRQLLRFFACAEDLSLELPGAVA